MRGAVLAAIRSATQKATGLIRRSYVNPPNTFDAAKWDDAQQKLMEAYNDEGYIYASIRPVMERVPGNDAVRTVNLRWEIDERSPAIVNRIEIAGNDYTHESCIREQIVLAPGQARELPLAPGLLGCLPDVPGWIVGDRGFASDAFRERIWNLGARPAIPPKRRTAPVACPAWIYNNRHLVENLWARLKEWRAVATRYEKTARSFIGVLCLAATADWLK